MANDLVRPEFIDRMGDCVCKETQPLEEMERTCTKQTASKWAIRSFRSVSAIDIF